MINWIYIISQMIGLTAFILSLIAYHQKNKKSILGNMIVSNVLNLIHYILLGAFSGCITKLIAIGRDYFIILKEKHSRLSSKLYLVIFMLIYILACIYTYDGILSLPPLIAAMIYLYFIWNGDSSRIRKTALFCYFLWLIYNIFVLSIVGIISNIISIISTLVAIKKNDRVFK